MDLRTITQRAGMPLFADKADESVAAKSLDHSPGLPFVEPHRSRIENQAGFEAEIEGDLQRAQRTVATVLVARIVCFAHAPHESR